MDKDEQVALIREWSAAACEGMDNTTTLCNMEDEVLGEDVWCEHCCKHGEGHREGRMWDLECAIGSIVETGALDSPLSEGLLEEMRQDLHFFRTGEEPE